MKTKRENRRQETGDRAQHTPGPWHVGGLVHGLPSYTGIGNGACHVARAMHTKALGPGEPAANARLIAAAPEMLKALKTAQEAIDVLAEDAEELGFYARAEEATDLACQLRSLIARATGGQG